MENFQSSERRRKKPKRCVSSDDDLVTETTETYHPRRRDSLVANSDIDVVNEVEDDQRFKYTMPKPTKSKVKAVGHGPPARKKSRRILASDPETDNEYDVTVDAVDSGHEFDDDDDDENDYFPSDPKSTTKASKGKGKSLVTTSAKGGTKRRAKVDNTEVPTTSTKRPKLTPKPDEVSLDVVGDGFSTPNLSIAGDHSIRTTSKHDSPPPSAPAPQPPLPKKQKLPTIKKVKLPNLNPSTSSSTVVMNTPVIPLAGKSAQDGVRKTLNGTIDIDLSNKSIYEEIFSKTGQGDGGTPRAGGNRRTKEEERRKELNRQRDEARAKRALEARQTFDLQAQFDKISRFEEKLKAEHSSALYPNFLAAKWREEWEKEKRRQKGHDPIHSHGHGSTTREEGEVR